MLVMAVKRRERKITQEELATKLGVSQVEISYYERGVTTPPRENRDKLAEILNVEPHELLMKFEDYVLARHGVDRDE